jgi:hypothetical protein
MSRKVFNAGEILTASDVNNFLMDQSVMSFASAAARTTAIPSPVEGMVTWLEDVNRYDSYNGTAWVPLIPESQGNAIINGAFDIWQRGTTFNTGGFNADRWQAFPSGTTTFSFSRQGFGGGLQLPNYGEAQFYLRYAVTSASGATFNSLVNRIEDVRTFAGQTVTLSYWARATSGTHTITNRLTQNFGSGGSGGVTVTGSTHTLTSVFQRFTSTMTLPTMSGKTVGAGNYLQVEFNFPLNTAFEIDVAGVQLEAGSVATPFRRNANSLQGELAACQRYYFRTSSGAFSPFGSALGYNTTAAVALVNLPVTMRVVPSSVEFSTLGLGDGLALVAATNVTLSERNPNYVSLVVTAASGVVAGKSYLLQQNNSGSAFLGFSAEL